MSKLEIIKLGSFDYDLDDEEEQQPPPKVKQATVKLPKSKEVNQEDDPAKHRELVLTCSRYGTNDRFKDFLHDAGFKFDNLGNKSVEQLTTMREQISSALSNRNATGIVKHAFFGALSGLERVPKVLKMEDKFDLTGLSNLCQNHPDISPAILDDLAEIECNMGDLTSMPPEKRLLLNVGLAAMRVASGNFIAKKMMLQMQQPVEDKPEKQEKQERQPRPDNVREEVKLEEAAKVPSFDFKE